MYIDGAHLSVSLSSVELHAAGAGTCMTYTEQLACLTGDGDELASRERGVGAHFDRLHGALG